MDVSVIIINYNTPQLIIDCIESINKNTKNVQYEIIVVDNASIDKSKEVLSKLSGIKYIYSDSNLGFGKANNLGVRYAKGQYVFFLNSDTILIDNAIKKLWKFAETYDGKLGACGELLLNSEGTLNHSAGVFPSIKSECSFLKKKTVSSLPKNIVDCGNYYQVDYITGADLFMNKQTFITIGGFDKKFFMYYEETDLQKRLAEAGYERILLKQKDIIHLEGGSFNTVSKQTPIRRLQMQLESRLMYMEKHLRSGSYLLFRLLYFFRVLPVAILFKSPWKSKFKYIKTLV